MSPNPNRDQQSGPLLTSCAMAAIAAELPRRAQPFATEHKASGDDRPYQASCRLAAAAENCRLALQDLSLDPPAGNNH